MSPCGLKVWRRADARWQHWAIAVGAGLIPLSYLLSIDEVLGGWGDDAWYLVLGKALATGQGFRAISLPSPPAVPLYPPGFPALLAVGWTACPSVSLNPVCFKLVPILLSLGFSVLSYLVLRASSGVSRVFVAAIVIVAGLQPYLTGYLGSTVMSDMPYAFLSMAVILLVEGYARNSPAVGLRLVAPALLLAGLYLTRSVGISLIFASGVYLLVLKMPWKALSLWAATAVLLAPWLYFSLTESGAADLMEPKGMRTYSDNLSWLGSVGAWGYLQFLVQNFADLLRVNIPTVILPVSAWMLSQGPGWKDRAALVNAIEGVGIAVAVMVVLAYLIGLRSRVTFKSLHLIELYVLCYVLIVLSQPVHSPRYLLPVAPFLTLCLFRAIRGLASWALSLKGPGSVGAANLITAVLLLTLGGSHLVLNGYRIYHLHWQPRGYYDQWPETVEAYRWIRSHTPPEALVAAPNPAQLYLYANRRAIYPPQSQEELSARRVSYVLNSAAGPPWVSERATGFQRVFGGTGGRVSVFRVE